MNNKNNLVVKDNALIMSKHDLTLGEQKLVALYVSLLDPQNMVKRESIKIPVKEYGLLLGAKNINNVYTQLNEMSTAMLTKILTIPKEKGYLKAGFFSSIEYLEGEGMIELSHDPKLNPYYYDLKKYTQYRLKHVLHLDSTYSFRLYEYFKSRQFKKHSFNFELKLGEIKRIVGLEETQYKAIKDFKYRVIDVAQKEFAEKTDLEFEYENIKTGRRVTGIRFLVKSKDKPDDIVIIEDEPLDPNVAMMIEISKNKLKVDEAEKILEATDDIELVKRNIEYTLNKKPKKFYLYLMKAVLGDYANPIDKEPTKEYVKNEKNRFRNFKGVYEDMTDTELERLMKQKSEKRKKETQIEIELD